MNVILDIGNVICDWSPERVVSTVFTEIDEQREALSHVFGHEDWIQLDLGTMALEVAIKNACKRTGFDQQRVADLFHANARELRLIPQMVAAVEDLSGTGISFFILSNMPAHSWEHLQRANDFWKLFQGIVISAHEKMIKPDPDIFQLVLDRYDLDPRNTLFLDDMQKNIEAADNLGFSGIHVPHPDKGAELLYRAIETHGADL